MGALLGLTFGLGLFLVIRSFTPAAGRRAPRLSRRERVAEMLTQAGVESVTPGGLAACCAGVGVVVAMLMYVVSHSPVIAIAFGVLGSWTPVVLVRFRLRQRRAELRDVWPEVADHLASAVRAGLSLPEALIQVGTRGPAELQLPFLRFGEDYRATGRFDESLDRLKAALADPVGDRIVESLRMARQVGGSDLGRLLRTLSAFLREDARTRAELETRQGWTINAARLAVAAPWIVLALLSLRPEAVEAYDTAAGLAVLGIGGGLSLVAYRVMLQIGRLPDEQRVLR